MQNPDWSRDELIVALDFYLRHRPGIPGKTSDEIRDLSASLRQINASLGIQGNETFRNANGVYMKLMNFRRFDPDYKGDGLTGGSREEEVVWDLYANKPAELRHVAKSIRSFSSTGETAETGTEIASEIEEAEEGRVLTRVHAVRERNATLVLKKKNAFKAEHSRLYCEVCGFDFEQRYGVHGDGFIECHHTVPVSELKTGDRTKIGDLVLVFSYCHRMLHRKRPWLSVDELRAKVVESISD
jgi:5-methylcytosine-specific restriction protein A